MYVLGRTLYSVLSGNGWIICGFIYSRSRLLTRGSYFSLNIEFTVRTLYEATRLEDTCDLTVDT